MRSRRYSPSSPSLSPPRRLTAPGAEVSFDKSGIAATFKVPGLVDIMSDSSKHTVTIAQFTVDANIQWYSVPKLDKLTYLKVSVLMDDMGRI